MDFGKPKTTPENGFDITLGLGRRTRFFHVGGNARIAREIALDIRLRGTACQVELTGEAKSAHAVDQPEVDDLGDTTLVGADVARRDAKNLGGGGTMYVFTLGKGCEQTRVFREVRHDSQLDL